jgi:HPt (histidine-containing phosphotransfer) domain-containing protein
MNPQSIIDLPTFSALQENMGADFVPELAQVYFEETPQLLAKLQAALGKKDAEAFRVAAHSIKSTSKSFGAMDYGAQAYELEMLGREGKLEGAEGKVQALVSGYDAVRQAIEELLNG